MDVQRHADVLGKSEPRHTLYLASVRLGQQEAWGKPVTISEGASPALRIVLTADVGTLTAMVTAEDGTPVPAVLAHETDRWPTAAAPRELLPGRGVAAGGLPSGAFAIADSDMIRTGSPERCGDRAAKVTVTAGQISTVSLRPCVPDRH
jgi:hypothetical protein